MSLKREVGFQIIKGEPEGISDQRYIKNVQMKAKRGKSCLEKGRYSRLV